MSTLAYAFALALVAGQQPAEPASQPAAQQAQSGQPGRASDVQADVTIIFELNERALNVQEDWSLSNPGGKAIPLAELEIPSPQGAKFLRVEPTTKGYKARETSAGLEASEPLTGRRDVQSGYILDLSGSTAQIGRPLPFSIQHARVVIQDAPGLSVTTSVPSEKRLRDLNGVSWAIYDLPQIAPGTTLDITIDGLPSHTVWPRRIAVVGVLAILAWMVWALATRTAPGKELGDVVSPMSARARRDQIVKAIEVLERELAEEKVKPKKYERRRSELMKELALVLREIELAKEQPAPRRGAPADA